MEGSKLRATESLKTKLRVFEVKGGYLKTGESLGILNKVSPLCCSNVISFV
jgi:hypothetical protein